MAMISMEQINDPDRYLRFIPTCIIVSLISSIWVIFENDALFIPKLCIYLVKGLRTLRLEVAERVDMACPQDLLILPCL